MLGITIVTPSFNQAPFLEQCIDSILSQNYPDLEYIIMDGGSTDGSVDIIKKYERHLAYWQSCPDSGQYNAINEGFRQARNPIMGWLNSDDMLHKDGLSVVNEVFCRLPEVEFLTSKRIGFDVNGDLASYDYLSQTWCHDLLLSKELILKYSLFIMQEGTFWRRRLWEKVGGRLDTSWSLAADFELWLRMSRHAALHTVNALTGGFRCYSMEQRCNKNRDEYIEQCCQIIDREIALELPPATHRSTPPPLIDYPLREKPAHFEVLTKREHPRISIVTPSFNQKQYLEECIDSVLSQNYPNLEYIVMDGGSTDGSAEIIQKYARHLNYWQSRKDYGQYHAVNTGFLISTGEVMAWLNSDDKYHPGAFWLVSDAFDSLPELKWLTGSPTLWDKEGNASGFDSQPPSWCREKYLQGKVHSPFIQQESTFWRRSLWLEAGARLASDFPFAADMELWARFFRHAQLHTLHAPLGGFRSHPGEGQRSEVASQQYAQEAERIVARERAFFSANQTELQPPPPPLLVRDVVSCAGSRITEENFGFFSYSRSIHFPYFAGCDTELYGRVIDPRSCNLKTYQELLAYSFLRHNFPKGSRVLVIADHASPIVSATRRYYECWSVPAAPGAAPNPAVPCKDVAAQLGSFSAELPDAYFQLVIGSFALETGARSEGRWRDICRDIDRVLTPDGHALHCFDLKAGENGFESHPLLPFLFRHEAPCSRFVPFQQAALDPFVFFRSEEPASPGLEPVRWLSYNVLRPKGYAAYGVTNESPAPPSAEQHAAPSPAPERACDETAARAAAVAPQEPEPPRRLHIGGETPAVGWEILNIAAGPHVDHVGNANDLSRFTAATFQEIYASHILEHLDYQRELLSTLKEWHRVLKPFGTLYLSVPDLDVLARLLLDKERLNVDDRFAVMRIMFGGHMNQHDFHATGLNEDFLTYFLNEAGFLMPRRVERLEMFRDTSSMEFKGELISLNMVARKLPG
ncbi:glycosyltransferase, WfgS family [Citrifermentans bemidjiense Bem]|uniref:Glycosyltransferase, WfgS family n=1 Tax=Citrifermentans bemidjiense (strain ATCC BAA-1014 / DSM 16622 / JCM 12645 / Bem) TaxID=404380 RepID=B5EDT4_CITBB|nr:glycosyltransferase [Citrifermentans bemidjiense]ACH40712.1 glycosyltransferase, WfgS family [Citrifermentans bemidjiense Bem]